MAVSSSALALAASLRARSDDALVALLHARPVREAGIDDVFDLAEALLDPASIQTALAHLDRATLGVLAAAVIGSPPDDEGAAGRRLAELALLISDDTRMVVPDAVAEVLRGWPDDGLPSLEQLIHDTPPVALEALDASDRASADRVASERAFSAVTAVGELVGALEREPARMLQRGGIALPDWRRLLAAAGLGSDAELATLLAVAEAARLVAPAAGAWGVTEQAERWRASSRGERWGTLAAGWLEQVPPELREQLAARAGGHWGEGLLEYLAWLYPAGGAWLPARTREVIAAAETLGIADGSMPSTAGGALLLRGAAAASAAMAEVFPPEVRQVYIQHDLSIIAPGPLASDVDLRLRELADVESVGLASSYRITTASVTRALTTGHTVEQLRRLLDEISLTGIPQPLEYLLSETAGRFGSLRVGPLEGDPGADAGAHSYVRADDPILIGQLVIDQALASLALRRTGDHRAVSRFEAETVYWALVDARYPAVFEDADGIIRPVRRTPPRPVATEPAPDPAVRLVRRIREAAEHQPAESGAAWNARQLELAIKAKLEVTVVVRMPDGTEVPYLLEPAALAGGRLRARDRRADIERTLPLSHIVAVEPASG